jgi:hypothetical protein
VRIPARIGDSAWFDDVAHRLMEIEAVESVTRNPTAGSILLLYRGDLADVLAEAGRRGLFTIGPDAPGPQFETRFSGVLERVRGHLREAGVPLESKSPLIAGLMVAGAVQLLRGKWLPSGLTLAACAAGITQMGRPSERNRPDTR